MATTILDSGTRNALIAALTNMLQAAQTNNFGQTAAGSSAYNFGVNYAQVVALVAANGLPTS